jgi:hypothetical protein
MLGIFLCEDTLFGGKKTLKSLIQIRDMLSILRRYLMIHPPVDVRYCQEQLHRISYRSDCLPHVWERFTRRGRRGRRRRDRRRDRRRRGRRSK